MILQVLHLRKLCFYNCHTCANYDFKIFRLLPTFILQLSHLSNYNFTIVVLAPNMNLQLSYLRQLWFYNCYIAPIIFLNNFTIVIFAPDMILQLSDLCLLFFFKFSQLRQLYFYDCHTVANYDFANDNFAPTMILQLLSCTFYVLKNVILAPNMVLQLS